MELISSPSDQDFRKLTNLYKSAFPPEERRPDDCIRPANECFSFCSIVDGGELIGLLTLWRFREFNYIEHFAVMPDARNRGYGSMALELIPAPVVLEVEPAECGEMALRRIEFYKRNGFRELDYDYMQPPYSAGLPWVPLRLMVKGELKVSAAEVARTLHRYVYNDKG